MLILDFETTEHLHESENSILFRARTLNATAPNLNGDGNVNDSGNGNVVLKILKGDRPSPHRLARFRRAFDTAALFHSPRILRVFRLESVANTLVSVMEDFCAESLASWIGHGPLALRECLTIAIGICDGLADIHSLGVIHMDIAPANVLWNRAANTVKITGFGCALARGRTLTVPYAAVLEGTLSHMSPEQTGRMNRPVDYRADFYSLGATLYELFTGEKPFAAADSLEMIHCHIAKRPVPPAGRRSATPEALSDLILKLMEKNAEDRYQSIEGIKADLVESLRRLDAHGTIGPSLRANHDVSSHFQVSARLYGREPDVALLFEAFERVAAGELAFTLISGSSGVGKSSLVQELYRPLTVARGRYVAGKYDQYQRSIPYSAVGQALNSFCDQLLCESPAVLQAWRLRFLAIVGKNGAALVEVIPRLETVIGIPPPTPEREPQIAQNLLKQLCQDFVQVICSADAPLVLFLDDLQWADMASLALLKTVLTNPRQRGLHLVGAYRDNEVQPGHPLVLMLEELAAASRAFATIHLESLSSASVAALVADSLSLPVQDVAILADIIFAKTHGNAFFATEFLKALAADGLLKFDFERRQWMWDVNQIHDRQITDNVVTLMAGRIELLPPPTQKLLQFAASIGNQFQLRTLAVIAGGIDQQTQIRLSLTPALQLGVVVPAEDACTPADPDESQQTFRFQHDRVQQAAYSLIPEAEKPAVHLHIARQLRGDACQRGDVEGSLFEIVSHFNKGASHLEDRLERLQAAQLNLQAGLKARKAAAYHAAWDFFRAARAFLPPDCFESEYDIAFQIHLGLAKSSSVAGRCAESEALYPLLLQKARTTLDKSQVHLVQMDDYHLQGAYDRAIAVQTKNLLLLGERVPANALEFTAAMDRELELTPRYRGARRAADLLAALEIDAPEMIAALKTLMGMWISAHLVSNEPIVQWCSIRMANLSLQHGNSELAAFAYVQYGYLCMVRLQRFQEGYDYGDLALKLADRCDNLEMRGKIFFLFGLYISHWKKHVALSTESLRKGYAFSVEGGDWTYAVYGACNIISNLMVTGVPCDEVQAEAQKFLDFLKDKAAVGVNSFFLPGGVCALLHLQGKTAARNSYTCQYLDETVFLNTLGKLPTIEGWFYAHKIRSMYLFRSFEAAAKLIAKAESVAFALPAQVRVSEAYFYSCLLLAATAHVAADASAARRAWDLFARYEQQMQAWADHCPENYAHKWYLIQGERARLEHRSLEEVLAWYDKGIQSARDCDFPNMVALAHELKGRYWLEKRQNEYALNDLKEAHYGYHRWGAAGKVAMLEEEFAELRMRGGPGPVMTPAHLDLLSVHKAARAISAKIEARDLIHTMMTIVMESAGADRGALLREKESAWQIEAAADLGADGITIAFPAQPREASPAGLIAGVPASVINYVLRTQASVTVSEPARDPRFAQDPYVARVGPRSILCVPVIHQGRTTGIIYLENKLGPGVFSAERVDLIDVLAAQIAISLENAGLYADLKNTVAQQQQVMAELNLASQQRLLAEAETLRLNAELEQRVQDRTAELTRSNQELEQFAYVASHDLQEPLRKVSSFAELLAAQYKGKLDGEADEFIGYMVDGARRMQILIQSMLAYSRLGSKGKPYAPTDGNAVLKLALANLQTAVEESGAEVTSAALPTVLADEGQLVQLFQNLIGNAIKFRGAEKPLVHVSAVPSGPAWTFTVRDNGIGIDPRFADRIFVIFQRLHSRTEYAGTGIGLSFCKKIVERHGGRIWMQPQPEKGTAFCFTLPRSVETHQPNPGACQ